MSQSYVIPIPQTMKVDCYLDLLDLVKTLFRIPHITHPDIASISFQINTDDPSKGVDWLEVQVS